MKNSNNIQHTHPCSSCDEEVLVSEMDSCGRCEFCQEEYSFEEDYEE